MKKKISNEASISINNTSVGIDLNSAKIACEYCAKSTDGYSYLINENGSPQIKYFFEIVKNGNRTFKKSSISKIPKNTYNMMIDSLLLRLRKTNMNPIYQRSLVWSSNDKTNLIDALIQGRSIGALTFVKNDFSDEFLYEILDGKQRLSTIAEFIADSFPYQNIFFSELTKAAQLDFLNQPVAVSELSFSNDKEKIEYFIELNSAGVKISDDFLKNLKNQYLKG